MGKEREPASSFEEGFVGDRREKEEAYREHHAREDWPDDVHPDGCFYCGSYAHPSDCCSDAAAVTEYWEG